MVACFVDMKLVATVCILMAILEPGESVKCYVSSDGILGHIYRAPFWKTLKEMKRNGTYSLTIREDCKFCQYDMYIHLNTAGNDGLLPNVASEFFTCIDKDEPSYSNTHKCQNATWFSAADGTVRPDTPITETNWKWCITDLCNTPCYEDATHGLPGHSPSASNSNGSNPSPNANPESTTTSGGIGLYNFGVILQLGCTTTIFAFTKWQI